MRVDRRQALALMLASAGAALTACAPADAGAQVAASAAPPAPGIATRTATPTPTPTAPAIERIPLPSGVLTELPGTGSLMAWTVDDGSNAEVIRKYVEFAKSTGTRLTFFLNGTYSGWTEHAALIRPLVESGQIQLGNHTWSHADLTELSDEGVVDELQRNHDFIVSTYGVDPRPYYRPPFGYRSARTDAAAASIGYTAPVLWYGTLSDSGLITPQQVVDFATQWFLPQHIVIGHLNFLPVTEVFPQLHQLLVDRGLRTITLDDLFLR